MAPHGVYPSAGDDRWVAVACRDDADWRALAALHRRDDLADLSTTERLARREELDDDRRRRGPRPRSPDEAMTALIAAGVPAHAVQNSAECWADPQLAARRALGHAAARRARHDRRRGLPDRAERHPGRGRSATPPLLGQDTVEILTRRARLRRRPPRRAVRRQRPGLGVRIGAAAPSRRVRPVVGSRSPAACQVRSRHHRRVELRASSALSTRTGETHDPHAPSDPHRRSAAGVGLAVAGTMPSLGAGHVAAAPASLPSRGRPSDGRPFPPLQDDPNGILALPAGLRLHDRQPRR